MKENKLVIKINKPTADLFAFIINPKNSPKWMDFIVSEQTNEWPPKVGTMYRDIDADGEAYEYVVTTFEPNKVIVLSQDWGYHERLTLTILDENTTELEYIEWTDRGDLPELTTMDRLKKLKKLVEAF